MNTVKDLVITTVLNPHLFWVISSNDDRNKTIEKLEKMMEETCKNHISKTNQSFEIGEIVAVRVQKKLCRAIIELIDENNSRYLCWLVDYGFIVETPAIFKLSPLIRKTPALALQASLNGVTYFEKHLDYDTNGEPTMVNMPVKTPTSSSRQAMLGLLSKSKSQVFKIENREDGIIFGDILYKDEQDMSRSLRDDLIDMAVLQADELVFEAIKNSINDYKERNLDKIIKLCNKPQEIFKRLNKGEDVKEKCDELVKKYLDEFDIHDGIGTDEDEFIPHPISSRNRSRNNNTNSSLDLTNSPKDTTPKGGVSKKKRLLETMLMYRKSLEASPMSPEEGNKENMNDSPDSDVSCVSSSRGKKLLEQMKKKKEEVAKEKNEQLVETPKSAGMSR